MGFYDMMQRCQDEWLKRLHTIDVVDSDTAKVNQFYSAMYRASFLPREMSDCNGDYPEFSTGITKHIDSSLLSLHSSLKNMVISQCGISIVLSYHYITLWFLPCRAE